MGLSIILDVLKEKVIVLNSLQVISFLIGILLFFISLIWVSNSRSLLKIGGVFFVTFLSLFANQAGVYALAIIIIATLITQLDFLENIAALFWGRKEFWDYRIHLAEASKSEIEDKQELEVKEDQKQNESTKSEENASRATIIRQRYDQFEKDVFDTLIEQKVFLSLKSGVKLTYGKKDYILDALGFTFDCDYVVEVKMGENRATIQRALHRMKEYLGAYKQYNSRLLLLNRDIRGLLVVPSTVQIDDIVDGIGILKFDHQNRNFTNIQIINNWIS